MCSSDLADGRTTGRAFLDAQYNGPPGMVHGGIIALLFDELLGGTNVCNGLGGFTGTLSIRYERPTWIEHELELESWVDRIEGRKVFTAGTISINGEVTARAEGIFIMTQGWKSEKQ
jgi:acyl-coenzyme A thioesterase PaaI-like protein